MASIERPDLCIADEATFWPWLTWTDFARLTPAEKADRTVIVPIAGFADWGLGHPLDAEELMIMPVLKAAIRQRPANFHPLVLPPLRFVLGPDPACAFPVDAPVAHAFFREVAQSVVAAGFRRLIFVNASPWNEEFCASASRDLRIEFGLQTFRINFSFMDLDLHPVRSQSRRRVQTLLTALVGCEPDALPATTEVPVEWPDEVIQPLSGAPVPLAAALTEGAEILATTAARVAALFGEIQAHPPLPRDGALAVMTPP